MFRFSVRGLAIYIAFVAMTLALTRVNSWVGVICLWLTSAAASSLLAPRTYRFAAWGDGWDSCSSSRCFVRIHRIHTPVRRETSSASGANAGTINVRPPPSSGC